jgi:flagellar basal-body rod modification protein FlgD
MSTVGSTSSSSSSSSTAGIISGAQQSLASDQSTFLTLLTAQLQHQDPLSPMDTNAFTQQLVSMTGVQQQILTNQLLQQMVGNQTAAGDPVNMIGKTVTANTDTASLQNGSATWQYSTSANAKDVSISVVNSLGQVVATSDAGSLTAGNHTFTWNGKDSSGVQLANGGTYTLQVTATTVSGGTVTTNVFQSGVVSGVNVANGQSDLVVNGASIPSSDITSVTGS